MAKELYFSDYIEVLMDNYDSIIYSPVYSNELGLYLSSEDEKPIKLIALVDSKLNIYYVDGEEKCLENFVNSVKVEDTFFRRRMNKGIVGSLFKYDVQSALLCDLDVVDALNKEVIGARTRKRSIR